VSDLEPVIGLEIHVQLATASKAFSSSGIAFGAAPNSLTDPLVLGLPGTLPTYNRRALELAVRLGVATGSRIRTRSRFARKQYFYPDLPKGYQITQADEPLCEDGHLDLLVPRKRIRLQRIHLEEDAGKSLHRGAVSGVDLNRAGVPLVEVVTAPELTSAEEAAEFMRSLHRLVRWLEISEGDMEKGQLRCDANVSLRRRGETKLGTRAELKNINSFRFVQRAIEHEIVRQTQILDAGGVIVQETRLWDNERGTSQPMRSKEEANDYRYFPDPDLPPLVVDGGLMGRVLSAMPALPAATFDRYVNEHGVAPDDARTLVNDLALAVYFEHALRGYPGPAPAAGQATTRGRTLANWILTELLGTLNADGKTIAASPVAPATLAALVAMIDTGTLSGKMAKDVLAETYRTGEDPAAIVARGGMQQLSDPAQLWGIVNRVVAANVRQAEAYAKGKDSMFGYFVGLVMKETEGRANPQVTTDLLHKRLGR
jgi:aspartyl-tRNA(Asn)/glutamyl-tRNA(Gln) amidotransferase subunit B